MPSPRPPLQCTDSAEKLGPASELRCTPSRLELNLEQNSNRQYGLSKTSACVFQARWQCKSCVARGSSTALSVRFVDDVSKYRHQPPSWCSNTLRPQWCVAESHLLRCHAASDCDHVQMHGPRLACVARDAAQRRSQYTSSRLPKTPCQNNRGRSKVCHQLFQLPPRGTFTGIANLQLHRDTGDPMRWYCELFANCKSVTTSAVAVKMITRKQSYSLWQ